MNNAVHAMLVGAAIPGFVGLTAIVITSISFGLAYVVGYIHLLFKEGFEIFYSKRIKIPECSTYVKVVGDNVQFTEEQAKEVASYLESQRETMNKVNSEAFVFAVTYSIQDLLERFPLAFYKLSLDYYLANILKNKKELLTLINTVDLKKKVDILKQEINPEDYDSLVLSDDFKNWLLKCAKQYGCDFNKLEKLNNTYKSQDEVLFSILEKR